MRNSSFVEAQLSPTLEGNKLSHIQFQMIKYEDLQWVRRFTPLHRFLQKPHTQAHTHTHHFLPILPSVKSLVALMRLTTCQIRGHKSLNESHFVYVSHPGGEPRTGLLHSPFQRLQIRPARWREARVGFPEGTRRQPQEPLGGGSEIRKNAPTGHFSIRLQTAGVAFRSLTAEISALPQEKDFIPFVHDISLL